MLKVKVFVNNDVILNYEGQPKALSTIRLSRLEAAPAVTQ